MSEHTPPQDKAAEASVLGSMLISADAILDVADKLTGADYYWPVHETIHDAIMGLHARREPVDMVTVGAELHRLGELQRCGGAPYLHTLASETPIAANAEHYAQIVADKATARRLADAGTKVQQLALGAGDMVQVAEDARQLVDAATATGAGSEAGAAIGDALDGAVDWLDTEVQGAASPWEEVNDRTNGLLDGSMITVAARPGHGKSLVAKDVCLFTAQQGKAAHIATLEMSRNEYMARILAGLARVDLGKMLRRQMNAEEWGRIGAATEKVRGLPLWLDDRERQTMAQIRASARNTARRFGELGVIAIDYAQLVQPANPTNPSREQQVAQISRDTKLLAKEFSCPVLLLAQLNRKGSERSDPRPIITDLRESGSLEQDSDQVWLLHRPDQHGDDERLGELDLIVAKNRNGAAPLSVSLAFQGHYARVSTMV